MTKINIRGAIVDDSTAGFYRWFGMQATAPGAIGKALDDAHDDVVVNINSNGGNVYAASEIYTMLRSYSGKVTINVTGMAASAASVIAMAGDEVVMSPTAQMMVHNVWTNIAGNANDLRAESENLDKADQSILNAYEAKTGMKRDELYQLLNATTFMDAKEAVDKGFADRIMFADESVPAQYNALDLMPSKAKINEFYTMMEMKRERKAKPSPEQSKGPSLQQVKLAMLLGQSKGEKDNDEN